MYAQEMLYDTLVTITEDGYEGCLAESWKYLMMVEYALLKLYKELLFQMEHCVMQMLF